MAILSVDQARERLAALPGWRLEHGTHGHDMIVRQFTFAGFPEAVAFVSRLVPGAEAADHHPDITINYRRVTLAFTTHSEGGLTDRDFVGAAAADRCV